MFKLRFSVNSWHGMPFLNFPFKLGSNLAKKNHNFNEISLKIWVKEFMSWFLLDRWSKLSVDFISLHCNLDEIAPLKWWKRLCSWVKFIAKLLSNIPIDVQLRLPYFCFQYLVSKKNRYFDPSWLFLKSKPGA
jgi:hypothetical protein